MHDGLFKILEVTNWKNGITFIDPAEEFLSYGQLYDKSLRLLNYLQTRGLTKDSKLVFQFNSNKNFVVTFWACLAGGIVNVPVSLGNNDEHKLKLMNIYNLLDDAYLIVDSDVLSKLEVFAKNNGLSDTFLKLKEKTIDIRDIHIDSLEAGKQVESKKSDLALIQFSSGSTGDPKGVVLTHENIHENGKGVLQTAEITKEDSYLSWFSLTHDMGLMGYHINPIILGVNQVLIETNVFIRRPLIWFDSATKYKSSILCSPNFGYKYLLKFLKKTPTWDLSNIRLIFNGAEPISASLCDEFLETLKPFGLKEEAMYPVYGLSEATVGVAFSKASEKFIRYTLDRAYLSIGQKVKDVTTDVESVTYVDVGYPLVNMQIRITDNDKVLDEDYIGHLEIKSVSVTKGYYKNKEATQKILKEDGWLDTGDLAFIRNKRLVITGRAKDIIIINGVNYYPHDIEEICFDVDECELNKVVAVGNRGQSQLNEELVIFVLYKKSLEEFLTIEKDIKKIVLQKAGLEVSKVIPIQTVYKTTSGKLQRFKLLEKYNKGELNQVLKKLETLKVGYLDAPHNVISILTHEAQEILGASVDINIPLVEQGFNSISLVAFKNKISEKLKIEIDITTLFDYPTLQLFSQFISKSFKKDVHEKNVTMHDEIAIISVACEFPDASSPEIFFDNLLKGVDSVKKSSRWNKDYFGGFLDDEILANFDNKFFDISIAEANTLDPQAKILLQTSLQLLERASIDYKKEKNIALFIGVSSDDNLRLEIDKNIGPYTLTSNLDSTLSGRVAYYFDFNAPAISLDTACSSSLVAIHQAINAIKNGDAKMAIAGGVNILLDSVAFDGLTSMQALSPTYRCHTFDESADGYVRGEGCGLVLLKPLKEAIQDKDTILAVIKNSVINHDGRSNGLTAPNGLSQQALLQKAYKDIARVDYIETHGTGTKLGDPIEINALASVFKEQKILLGAVKTNIGHLEASAGIAGVIKTVMAMQYKKLPPNLHLHNKNQFINWDSLSLEPLSQVREWTSDKPRVAGVSSFGFSGTNAHVVLEEFVHEKKTSPDKAQAIILISAKTKDALAHLQERYLDALHEANLKDFTYTTSQKYKYSHKIALVGKNVEELKNKHAVFESGEKIEYKTLFVFTGQGSQYPNMGKELFDDEPLFRKYFLECDGFFKQYLEKSLVDVLYKEDASVLNQPIYTQSSIFAVEYALAKYLIDLNIKPDGVMGHSLGEYVGAVISEILSLKDAVHLVVVRAKLIETIEHKGAMVAVGSSEEKLFEGLLEYQDSLSIASVNGVNSVVVSGHEQRLEEFVTKLKTQNTRTVKLNVNQAYHSLLLDSILFDFYYEAEKIVYNKPTIPFISSMKAIQMQLLDANYFTIHLRNSVRFADTIAYANMQKFNLFIEIGADAQLSSLMMQETQNNSKVLPTLRKNKPQSFYETLATLYVEDFDIDWNIFYKEYAKKIVIPTHPMDKNRFEINTKKSVIPQTILKQTPILNAPIKRVATSSIERLKTFIYQVSGIQNINTKTNLFELGLDSLSLFQLRENVKKEFFVEINMKDFYQTFNTLELIALHIDKNSKEEVFQEIPDSHEHATVCSGETLNNQQLVQEQLVSINNLTKLFEKQLEVLGGKNVTFVEKKEQSVSEEMIKNAQLKTLKITLDEVTLEQQKFIENFMVIYNEKHKESKSFTINNKAQLADWINSIIYRQTLKEITYPIVAMNASGAYFFDKDGNKYLDISMGYGSVFLGHNHPRVKEAMENILQNGYVLSPQTSLVEGVTTLICEFTKAQRVVFSNTGTEAVMAVLRAVRSVTKRAKIIKFQGSFHGTTDTILNTGDQNGCYPISSGINRGAAEGMLEFQYGSPQIFDFLKEHYKEIAAVIVEPVQSRRPDMQPKEFLKKLREITEELDIALVFDEMITGFRCARGGASEIFDILPDIATYGKVVGGTMPIGIIAGKSKYLDVFDGGHWEYGDSSYPQIDMMSFGGTFCKHPLTLSASLATLEVLKENPNIHHEVNQKTDYLAHELNQFFRENNYPIKINHFGSLFKFDFYGDYSTALNPIEIDLFFYLLINKGVYTWEKRICFLSAAHTFDDLDFIIQNIKDSLHELQSNGFFSKVKTTTTECTSFQKRLYILSQFEKNGNMNNMYGAWKIEKFEFEKGEKIFEKLLQFHPSLQTNFFLADEVIYQKINKHPFSMDVMKVQEDRVELIINEYVNKEFDLAHDLLFKVLVLEVQEHFILVLKTHHIVFDGPSIDILMEGFYKLYANQELHGPQKDYFDFSQKYNSLIKSGAFLQQEKFWLEKLKAIEALNLPLDSAYPNTRTYNGSIEYFQIDATLTGEIKKLAKDYHVSINMLLYASFMLLLHKLSSQTDITIGIPVTVRDSEFRDVVGMFANIIAIRQKMNPDISVIDFMHMNRNLLLEVLDNIEYPFEEIIEKLDIEKDFARNALFDVMFIYEDGTKRVFDTLQPYSIKKKFTNFDLTLEVIDENNTLSCSFEYYSDVFHPSTIKRWIQNFIQILHKIKDKDTKLSDIDIRTKEEIALIESFNNTQKEYPKDKTIVQLFEEQVQQNPNNIAVVYEDTQLTYEELNSKANQLAHKLLHEYNIIPDDLVAISLERSLEMIIGILGILKSGGAYVPIDPSYPKERIEYIKNDAQPKTILYKKDIESLDGFANTNLKTNLTPTNLMYIIYTSGSTGNPKGVMVEHRGVVNTLFFATQAFGVFPTSRYLQFATFTFDISVEEIFTTLLSGATLVTAPKDTILEQFDKLVRDKNIDIVDVTPSLLTLAENLDRVKTIITGGESALAQDAMHYAKTTNYLNTYGPTEASIFVALYKVNPNKEYLSIPIGKPIPNTQLYILDTNQNQLPLGAIGELYIGGDGLARGYLNQPELTSQKFINHPTNGRIYKSGDLAKYLSDGNIEYLGRIDDQVKIRGFRIELGEIENTILSFSTINECVVIASNSQLIAYIVGKTKELKTYLKEKLPSYMVPSYFVELEKLPLTSNGKVDKKALQKPSFDDAKEYKVPQTKTQIAIAEIFKEVLHLEKLSIDDNFFEIGGHSLSAISTIAKIGKMLHVEIKLKEIFLYPTIESLAKLCESKVRGEYFHIEPIAHAEHYSVSNSQRRLWVLDKMQDGSNTYNMPALVSVDGEIEEQLLQDSFAYLIQRHEILRTNFIDVNGEVRQLIKDTFPPIVESVEIDEDSIDGYVLEQSKHVFNLQRDMLIFVKIINKNILFVNMHHIISDGWSINVIIKEISQIYSDLKQNRKPLLEPLKIQYKDYTYWQNTLLENTQHLKEYWLNILESHKTLDFPTDFTRPNNQSFEGDSYTITFDAKRVSKLRTLSKDTTLFTVLLFITNVLLTRYTHQEDIIIGTPVANRLHEELFGQIGFYINTLAMRNKLEQNKSVKANLLTMHTKSLDAFEHQSYPFDKLVDELNLERDLSQNPLFNIMMILQNNEQVAIKLHDLIIEDKPLKRIASKFDLTFDFREIDDAIALTLEYSTALFHEATIKRIALNLETLIDSIELDKNLIELEILSNEEKVLLESFNNTQQEYPKDKTIVQLFEEQVKENPNNSAVVYENIELTYKELSEKANNLAHFIRDNFAITKDSIISIMTERGEAMIIAMMGVLKAGCAYLPLDSTFPKERIAYMLEDSQTKLILCDKANYEQTKDYENIATLDIEEIPFANKENLQPINSSLDLAYIIYTSGSTGKPKGVMIEHRSVINTIFTQIKTFNMTQESRFLQFASFSFDASIEEILTTLLSGATLIMAQKNKILNDFSGLVKKHKITIVSVSPSFLHSVEKVEGLETIITAGERIIVQDALEYAKNSTYLNVYGPTESSITSSVYKVNPKKEYKDTIPIGKPIANTQLYILDKNLSQVPLGATGELCIAGAGLARGYLNKQELSDEKFISHRVFGRIYKSGDLVKYQADGNIEYLGRIDDQISIRGFRIELGEVENSILSYPSIQKCVVVASNQQLVAYIVGETKELKTYLKEKLPSYMIPSYFIELEKLPLTPNGKVDKKALPNPDIQDANKTYVLAQNEKEQIILDAFGEVLSAQKISTQDNFFEIGGDSIKAIQISSKIASKGYKIDIKDIFRASSIQELAHYLTKTLKSIKQDTIVDEILLNPIQQWFFELDTPKNHFNQSMILQMRESIDANILKAVVKKLQIHHDSLRVNFPINANRIEQINHDENFTQEVIVVQLENLSQIEEFANKFQASFDIHNGSLMKVVLFKIDNEEDRLLLILHHLIVDGVSWRIVLEDLENGYTEYKKDKTVHFPLKTTSYQEYSQALREYATTIMPELTYWQELIKKNFVLSSDMSIAKRVYKEQNRVSFNLSKQQTKELLEEVHFAYNTQINDILLASLTVALYKTFGIQNSIITLEGHGREPILDTDISRTLGWFTTTYPIELQYDETLSLLIKFTKESLRAVPNKGIGYGILKYIAKQNLNYTPQIIFNYLGEFDNSVNTNLFTLAKENSGKELDDDFIQEQKLEINGFIRGGELVISLSYNKFEFHDNTMNNFTTYLKDSLISVIQHCKNQEQVSITPSDLSDEDFDIESLNEFLEDFNEGMFE